MARHFNSANPDYATPGTGVRGTDLVGVLVCCWVKLDDTAAQHSPMSRWNAGDAHSQWLLSVHTGGQVFFNIMDSALTGHFVAGGTIASGAWHHIAGMYDGATMHVLVDGVDTTSTINVGLLDAVGTTNVYIGRQTDAAYFNGAIAEAAILLVNTGVTPARNYVQIVQSLAQGASLSQGMYDTELIGYWPMLGGDSPEPDYGASRTTDTDHPATLTGTTTVSHAPCASIFSFGRSPGLSSGSAIA